MSEDLLLEIEVDDAAFGCSEGVDLGGGSEGEAESQRGGLIITQYERRFVLLQLWANTPTYGKDAVLNQSAHDGCPWFKSATVDIPLGKVELRRLIETLESAAHSLE